MKNIIKSYSFLTKKKIEISVSPEEHKIKIPLIDTNKIETVE
jgi:hypothetical protein